MAPPSSTINAPTTSAISAAIFAALSSLQAQVIAAGVLEAAPRSTVIALQLNAANLVTMVQQALVGGAVTATGASTTTGVVLDTPITDTDAVAIINDVLNVAQVSYDQRDLALMRGLVGRVASNLNQLP